MSFEKQSSEEQSISHEIQVELARPLALINSEAGIAFPDDKEQAEVFRSFLLRGKHSPETQAIDTLAHEKMKVRGWDFIDLYGGMSIRIERGGATRHLLTNKLNGCVASLIITEHADGVRDVVMTHFPDLAKERNVATYKRTLNDEMRRANKKSVVLLATKRHSGVLPYLQNALREQLGDDVRVEVDYYKPDVSKEDTGVMIVKIPSKEGGLPEYRTWEKRVEMKI